MALRDYFTKDLPPRQRQYEAIRAVAFNEAAIKDIAERFGYTPQTLRMLINRLVHDKLQLFPDIKRGPKGRHIPSETENVIIQLRRKKMLSSREITEELNRSTISIGVRTVERILTDAGFPKLRRRTDKERGISKEGTVIPKRSMNLSLKTLHPFRIDCQVTGIFDIVQGCALPESGDIGKQQAALSMLLLKLIGNERLSHIRQYNTDAGFGIFAGLNVLPKPTYMCSYSCRTDASAVMKFQQRMIKHFNQLYPDLYQGKTINLDFHSIPHFGEESEMDKVWCATRGKSLRGANTFFAQDGESDSLIYTRSDIKRAESSEEIKKFIDYWGAIKGIVKETLVFDSKLTRYDILYELDNEDVKFITLRTRSK